MKKAMISLMFLISFAGCGNERAPQGAPVDSTDLWIKLATATSRHEISTIESELAARGETSYGSWRLGQKAETKYENRTYATLDEANSNRISSTICYTGPRGGRYTITASGNKNYDGC